MIKPAQKVVDNQNSASHSHDTEIEMQNVVKNGHVFKKVRSFNVAGKDYNQFVEDHHDEHHHLGAESPGHSQNVYYMIDPEALKSGTVVELKDKTANPAPLGLLGFGLTTFLLNLHNAGVYPVNSMIMGMGVFYGGMAQVIAGIFEWKKGNQFAMVAFLSYGLFWISFCTVIMLPETGLIGASDPMSLALYLFIWGIFSLNMFIATLKKAPYSLCFVFFTVVVLFMLLAAHFWSESPGLLKAAGIEGIICGLSAIYVAFGEILNPLYGRTLIPLGERTPAKH